MDFIWSAGVYPRVDTIKIKDSLDGLYFQCHTLGKAYRCRKKSTALCEIINKTCVCNEFRFIKQNTQVADRKSQEIDTAGHAVYIILVHPLLRAFSNEILNKQVSERDESDFDLIQNQGWMLLYEYDTTYLVKVVSQRENHKTPVL